ncbi:hypothetical protein EJK17_00595 [Lactobacillus xujianguonis]|uniref:Uncharacterized protein n=1 Tax=Lactobacillus xujianguonis TaxID=2495899 RepID=A0A437SY19_9LACO|nr:hypothetical protein [Lactobacillus xujianguonis]RVU71806.1 hypothetical protein EJK17_00595 [Lactobacillus xujianguonis]
MSYWISLVDAEPPHDEIWEGVHCSWNYSNIMDHLPCGWARDWQGKQARDMIKPIWASMAFLTSDPKDFRKFEVDHEKGLGTVEVCNSILKECFDGFSKCPEGIIRID